MARQCRIAQPGRVRTRAAGARTVYAIGFETMLNSRQSGKVRGNALELAATALDQIRRLRCRGVRERVAREARGRDERDQAQERHPIQGALHLSGLDCVPKMGRNDVVSGSFAKWGPPFCPSQEHGAQRQLNLLIRRRQVRHMSEAGGSMGSHTPRAGPRPRAYTNATPHTSRYP